MAPRKQKTLLFDVMPKGRPSGLQPPREGEPGGGEDEAAGTPGNRWSQSAAPVVLRLPRGYAVLMGIGILLLLVLSHLAGDARGYRRGFNEAQQRAAAQQQRVVAPEERMGFWSPMVVEPGSPEDPRLPGMYYFHLTDWPLEDSRRLVEFMRGHGVAAFATPWHNNLFRVWAGQGFSGEEEFRDVRQQYMDRLVRLGQKWFSRYGIHNLPGINLQQYRPPQDSGG